MKKLPVGYEKLPRFFVGALSTLLTPNWGSPTPSRSKETGLPEGGEGSQQRAYIELSLLNRLTIYLYLNSTCVAAAGVHAFEAETLSRQVGLEVIY